MLRGNVFLLLIGVSVQTFLGSWGFKLREIFCVSKV